MTKAEDGWFELGNDADQWMPLAAINMLTQVRRNYGSQSDSDELEGSVRAEGILQPPTVAFFSEEGAKNYLRDLRRVFGVRHDFKDLIPIEGVPDGEKYPIAVMGHRRFKAATEVCRQDGILEKTRIRVHKLKGDEINVLDILSKQYQENLHIRPDSVDDARAVYMILKAGMKDGRYATFADCAKHLGGDMNDERVARAYRFMTLPKEIREEAEKGTLSFGRAMMLSQLLPVVTLHRIKGTLDEDKKERLFAKAALGKLYQDEIQREVKDDETRAVLLEEYKARMADIIDTNKMKNSDAQARVKNIIGTLLGEEDSLFVWMVQNQDDILRTAEIENDAKIASLAAGALRTFIAVLSYEKSKIERGKPTILGRNRATRHLMGNLIQGFKRLRFPEGASLKDVTTLEQAINASSRLTDIIEGRDLDSEKSMVLELSGD